MAKKTHPVADSLAFANYQLARTDEFATADYKAGICSMIRRIGKNTSISWNRSVTSLRPRSSSRRA